MLKQAGWFGGHLSPTSVSGCVGIPRPYVPLNQWKRYFICYFTSRLGISESVGQGIRIFTGTHKVSTHKVSRAGASEGRAPDISDLLGDLDMPEIDQDLETYQQESGAVFLDVSCAQPITSPSSFRA